MADSLPRFEDAELLRKTNPAAALELFRRLWEEQCQFRAAARYAYCLRKVGRADEAVALCRAALIKYPGNQYIYSELVWDLFETKIKPAKKENNLNAVLQAADEIIALEPNDLAIQKVAMTVMQMAKAHSKWKIVLEWADRVDPTKLNNQSRQLSGKRIMSDRETFYVEKCRALLEDEKFTEARTLAHAALNEFPNDIYLSRTAALALARDGQVEQAIVELKQLILAQHADWYVKADLAELELEVGHASNAYRLCCEAAQNRQDDEFKLSLFISLARAAIATDRRLCAAEHIALSKALRDKHNWRIPAELTRVEYDLRETMKALGEKWPPLPNDIRELSKLCQRRWQEGTSAGLVKKTGRLGRIDATKPYSFIFPDDHTEKIFVALRNVPKAVATEGKHVEFLLKPSFDRKKGVESNEAVEVRAVMN